MEQAAFTLGRIGLCLIALAVGLSSVGPVMADDVATHSVTIPAGADGAAISGRLHEAAVTTYVLAVEAGQHLILSFAATTPDARFSVTAPGDAEPLFEATHGESSYDAILSVSGQYRIRVYMTQAATGRAEAADFRLGLRLTRSD